MRHKWLDIISSWPISVHHFFADYLLYPFICYVARYRRKIVDKNIRNAFPDWSEAERKALRKKFYHRFSDVIVETVYGYSISDEEIEQRVQYIDDDAVTKACHQYGGAITMLSHLGAWELMADYGRRARPRGVLECIVYRRLKNKYFNQLMLDIRSKRGGECVEKDVLLRRMIQLRQGELRPMYAMLADQKPSPRNAHVWTRFMGQETAFLNGSEVLSKKFGYPCFYGYIRSPRRGYYTMQLIPMTSDNITVEYARLLEQNILEQPELWLWSHNRWKFSRPQ